MCPGKPQAGVVEAQEIQWPECVTYKATCHLPFMVVTVKYRRSRMELRKASCRKSDVSRHQHRRIVGFLFDIVEKVSCRTCSYALEEVTGIGKPAPGQAATRSITTVSFFTSRPYHELLRTVVRYVSDSHLWRMRGPYPRS